MHFLRRNYFKFLLPKSRLHTLFLTFFVIQRLIFFKFDSNQLKDLFFVHLLLGFSPCYLIFFIYHYGQIFLFTFTVPDFSCLLLRSDIFLVHFTDRKKNSFQFFPFITVKLSTFTLGFIKKNTSKEKPVKHVAMGVV